MNRNWESSRQDRIDNKMRDTLTAKQQAVDKRIRELEQEGMADERGSETLSRLRNELEEFRRRMKTLYTDIFQGSKELSIRKNDLIRQIRGNDLEEEGAM